MNAPPQTGTTLRSIAIVNQKGGVAKTTTAVSIAAAAAELGHRVLLVDLDPQASATRWLNATPRTDDHGRPLTILQILDGTAKVDDVAAHTVTAGIHMLPASIDLVGAERTLSGQPGAELALRAALAASTTNYDLTLFDCPPTLGLLAVNALCAAREVLIPVGAGAMDLDGVAALIDTVKLVEARLNPGLAVTAVLATQVRPREVLSRDVLAHLERTFPGKLLPSIRRSVRLSEAPSAHEPITVYDATGSAAQDYRDATTALLNHQGA